jgi:secernin
MCDTMVRVLGDRLLFAKNSDRDPNEAQALTWQPAREHPPGARLHCTHLDIPQARATHAVLLSRPFWMWGAEMGANEHGVVIGNEAVFTTQPDADVGLTGMDLLRLGLERSATAQDAVQTIVSLLEEHGQGGGCGLEQPGFTYHNSFLVADGAGALVVETAGRRWAVEQVASGARSISNGLTIPAFARVHADRLRTRVASCATRRAATEAGAGRAGGVGDLMAVLRDHGDQRVVPRYSPVNGGMGAVCMHAGGLVASSQTTASWVSELTGSGARHWATATAAPCTSLFKPVEVTRPVDLGPAPTDVADDATPWWRHERLHRRVLRDPQRLLPPLAAERDEIERAWLATPPTSEAAFAEADRHTARWLERAEAGDVRDRRPPWVRRYWRVRDARAGLTDPSRTMVAAARR